MGVLASGDKISHSPRGCPVHYRRVYTCSVLVAVVVVVVVVFIFLVSLLNYENREFRAHQPSCGCFVSTLLSLTSSHARRPLHPNRYNYCCCLSRRLTASSSSSSAAWCLYAAAPPSWHWNNTAGWQAGRNSVKATYSSNGDRRHTAQH